MFFTTYRKYVFIPMGIVMLGGVAVAYWPFVQATREVKQFCADIPAGTSLAEVQGRVTAAGYELSELVQGNARVHDPVSRGRRTCDLRFDTRGRTTAP